MASLASAASANRFVGLSKLARVSGFFAGGLQLQERLTTEIASA
jgi:GTP cyclohydrolase I